MLVVLFQLAEDWLARGLCKVVQDLMEDSVERLFLTILELSMEFILC